MKRTILPILVLIAAIAATANDAIFYAAGSFLVPTQETDIRVSKEVLTITIGADEFALVDVYYEFDNPKEAKTLLMAFEADPPYNDSSHFNHKGIHPHIFDFTVTMNGTPLKHKNAVIETNEEAHQSQVAQKLQLLDGAEWQGYGEAPEDKLPYPEDFIYNSQQDRTARYSYAYYFNAPFVEGRNTVHHTYRYRMSLHVGVDYDIPYWLTPAMRWANHQIDDFTLRIIDNRGEAFCMKDSLFASAPFRALKGECWQLSHVPSYDNTPEDTPTLFASGHSTVECHVRNFRPTENITITCIDELKPHNNHFFMTPSCMAVVDREGIVRGQYLGTCGDQYLIDAQDYGLVPKEGHQLKACNAEDGEGFLTISREYTGVNVRQQPSAKSPVVTTIHRTDGEMPDVYQCHGYYSDNAPMEYKYWYHITVGNKSGYVRSTLMEWNPDNKY